ncbi:hypothetical protein KY290_003776 [Solanum tuberosum]|uniref:Uncharacterized protein n=1 Tax=Solanum tuberosum TaxID=4113 RepID=A0ABQ7WTU5_SOLTU|nr:hypothetical protein KY290_003776 [Solanum tuberosum]
MLHLSDIDDQESLRIQMPILMFYKYNSSMEGKDPAKIIKDGLSNTLVFYYPLDGRIVEGPNRKLMVNCNSEGIMFIEADANVELEKLGDSIIPPCPYIEELLYNEPGSDGIIGCTLMLVQGLELDDLDLDFYLQDSRDLELVLESSGLDLDRFELECMNS